MKYYVISDIHGSALHLEKVLKHFDEDGDYLLILGDILYHGPRNPLPDGYDPKRVAALLNERKEKIIAVRGNCDSEVDQMVLAFPITADYQILPFDGYKIFMTHGHLYDEDVPWLGKQDAILFGHVHLQHASRLDGRLYLNPGSLSLPKLDSVAGYGILENDTFTIYDLDQKIVKSCQLKEKV